MFLKGNSKMETKSINPVNFTGVLVRLFVIIMAVALIAPVTAFSQKGAQISIAVNNSVNPVMTTGDSRGTIIARQDKRNGNNSDIHATWFKTSGFITIAESGTARPNDFSLLLLQSYQNPFNPATVINYQLPNTSNVKLTVYDALGHVVNLLVNETQNAGDHNIVWNAGGFPSGVYFYRLEAGSLVSNKKMILLK
jgi:hypothetical protein